MLVQIFLCWLNDSSYCYLNAHTNFYVDLTILQIASWMLVQLDSDGTQGKQWSNVWKCSLIWVWSQIPNGQFSLCGDSYHDLALTLCYKQIHTETLKISDSCRNTHKKYKIHKDLYNNTNQIYTENRHKSDPRRILNISDSRRNILKTRCVCETLMPPNGNI